MKIEIYTDGSYSTIENLHIYAGSSLTFIDGNTTPLIRSKAGSDSNIARLRNVAGELIAVMDILTVLDSLKAEIDEIHIYYDYKGIECWATGEWKAKKVFTQEYKKFMSNMQNKYRIHFHKVRAHANNELNNQVDTVVKEAVRKYAQNILSSSVKE